MYDVGKHLQALNKACDRLSKEIENDEITACIIIRQTKSGGFRYSLTGNHVNAYTWTGFLEEVKLELLNMVEI